MKYSYVVHSTVPDPLPESTYGTVPPTEVLALAVAWCTADMQQGRRSFITKRDKHGNVLAVIPVFLTGADTQYNLSAEELGEIVMQANAGGFKPASR